MDRYEKMRQEGIARIERAKEEHQECLEELRKKSQKLDEIFRIVAAVALGVACLLFIAALVLSSGCNPPRRPADYPLVFDAKTAGGVEVGTNGQAIDLDRLDAIIARVQSCLGQTVNARVLIAPAGLDHNPPGWVVSKCTGAQVFECGALPSMCKRKPTRQCPCRCAGALHRKGYLVGGPVVIATPNLETVDHEYIHAAGAISHDDPRFAKCDVSDEKEAPM